MSKRAMVWRILCVVLASMVVVISVLAIKHYRSTHIFEKYQDTGRVIGYEESTDGLIIILQVESGPHWLNDDGCHELRILVNNDTELMVPSLLYVLQKRLVGYELLFTTREFWLPDAMSQTDYVYPSFGFVLQEYEWDRLIEEQIVQYQDYEAFLEVYERDRVEKDTLDWLA